MRAAVFSYLLAATIAVTAGYMLVTSVTDHMLPGLNALRNATKVIP